MELELVICSWAGKTICHFRKSAAASVFAPPAPREEDEDDDASIDRDKHQDDPSDAFSHAFVSSLQGLRAFVGCMQHEELQAIETDGVLCVFQAEQEILTYAAIVRALQPVPMVSPPTIRAPCLRRLLKLLHAQIVFVLSDRGLDVLRKQPGYDLRELLTGTDRVMCALASRWLTDATYRLRDLGVRFLRMPPERRDECTRALQYEPARSADSVEPATICSLLFASGKVVTIVQPMKKHFRMRTDDLLLLANFIYATPAFRNSETWTPICLPHFNARGFVQAYITFLTSEVSLVLLSTQQSPTQFHQFQAKRTFIQARLEARGLFQVLEDCLAQRVSWRPHCDLPLLHHFVYKNELTGECWSPQLEFPFDAPEMQSQLLDQYALLHHQMFPSVSTRDESQIIGKRLATTFEDATAARMVVHRTSSAVYVGMCSTDARLYAWFDVLAATADAQEQCLNLLERLKHAGRSSSNNLNASSSTVGSSNPTQG